jgi:hypothetical protein
MSLRLRCVFLGHKWMPGEAANEPGIQMICRRCGRLASHVHFPGGKTVNPADERKDLDYGGGGGIDAGGAP